MLVPPWELHPTKKAPRRYCSHRCRGVAGMLRLAVTSPTTIETETYSSLMEMGFVFEPQYRIRWYVVDAFVPSLNTVVEVLGDFFHCNPDIYPAGPRYVAQRKNAIRDKQRFMLLERWGYRVIKLWERDIREHGAVVLLQQALASYVLPADSLPCETNASETKGRVS